MAWLRKNSNVEVVWVTSGAIASAVDRTQFKRNKNILSEKQALSAIGQPIVMDLYNLALQASGHLGAQILLTYDDLDSEVRKKNFQNTVEQLLKWGVTPILNENDAVATEEIRFGDNDWLSAKVADALGADRLVILTDVEGLYDKDPKKNKNAKQIFELKVIDSKMLERMSAESGSSRGTGGMYSKLKAADHATKNGIETWLVRGDRLNILTEVYQEKKVGTRIQKK